MANERFSTMPFKEKMVIYHAVEVIEFIKDKKEAEIQLGSPYTDVIRELRYLLPPDRSKLYGGQYNDYAKEINKVVSSRHTDTETDTERELRAKQLLIDMGNDGEFRDFLSQNKTMLQKDPLIDNARDALQQVFFSNKPKLTAAQSLAWRIGLLGLGMGGFILGAPKQAADVASHMTQLFTGNSSVIAGSSIAALIFAALLITAAYHHCKHKKLEGAMHALQETKGYKAIVDSFNTAYQERETQDVKQHDKQNEMFSALEAEAYCLEKIQKKFDGGWFAVPKVLRQDFVKRACQFILQSSDRKKINEVFSLLNDSQFWDKMKKPAYRPSARARGPVVKAPERSTSVTMNLLGDYLYQNQAGMFAPQEQKISSLQSEFDLKLEYLNLDKEKIDKQIEELRKTRLYHQESTTDDGKATQTLADLIASNNNNIKQAISFLTEQKDKKSIIDESTIQAAQNYLTTLDADLKPLKDDLNKFRNNLVSSLTTQDEKKGIKPPPLDPHLETLQASRTQCKEKMKILDDSGEAKPIPSKIAGHIQEIIQKIETLKSCSSDESLAKVSTALYRIDALQTDMEQAKQELTKRLDPRKTDIENLQALSKLTKKRDHIQRIVKTPTTILGSLIPDELTEDVGFKENIDSLKKIDKNIRQAKHELDEMHASAAPTPEQIKVARNRLIAHLQRHYHYPRNDLTGQTLNR